MRSPLYQVLQKRVRDAIDAIIKQQVVPWSFLTAGPPFRIKSFDGHQISYQNVRFEGSPRETFWSRYVEPFLEHLCIIQVDAAVLTAREKGVDVVAALMDLQDLLLQGCHRTFTRMADVDRRLRGNGQIHNVELRSTVREMSAMAHFVEALVNSELEMSSAIGLRSVSNKSQDSVIDVFLSYAREDTARLRSLSRALRSQSWSLFADREIPAGQAWRAYIGKQLKSARCILVAWSTASVESLWVQEEADEAFHRGVMIPVLLDSVTPPYGFRSFQAADLSKWQGDESASEFLRLTEDIARVLTLSAPIGSSDRMSGIWEGEMYQRGAKPFQVRLVLTKFNEGQIGGSIEHRILNARGTLKCVKQAGNSYYYEQIVDYGREVCLDGLNKVVLLDENTLERTYLFSGS